MVLQSNAPQVRYRLSSETGYGAQLYNWQKCKLWFSPDLYVWCNESARPFWKYAAARFSKSEMSNLAGEPRALPLGAAPAVPLPLAPAGEKRRDYLWTKSLQLHWICLEYEPVLARSSIAQRTKTDTALGAWYGGWVLWRPRSDNCDNCRVVTVAANCTSPPVMPPHGWYNYGQHFLNSDVRWLPLGGHRYWNQSPLSVKAPHPQRPDASEVIMFFAATGTTPQIEKLLSSRKVSHHCRFRTKADIETDLVVWLPHRRRQVRCWRRPMSDSSSRQQQNFLPCHSVITTLTRASFSEGRENVSSTVSIKIPRKAEH